MYGTYETVGGKPAVRFERVLQPFGVLAAVLELQRIDREHFLADLVAAFRVEESIEARCLVQHPMTRNRFVIEVGDTQALKSAITRLRAIDSVFDAYRVTPAGG